MQIFVMVSSQCFPHLRNPLGALQMLHTLLMDQLVDQPIVLLFCLIFKCSSINLLSVFWNTLVAEDGLKSLKVIQDLRLRVDIGSLWEMVKLVEIEVQWVDKTPQLADPLTQYGASIVCLMDVLTRGKL